jgi:hypothetical protein
MWATQEELRVGYWALRLREVEGQPQASFVRTGLKSPGEATWLELTFSLPLGLGHRPSGLLGLLL